MLNLSRSVQDQTNYHSTSCLHPSKFLYLQKIQVIAKMSRNCHKIVVSNWLNFTKQQMVLRLDSHCFEVTNAPHKNLKKNNIEAIKLDHGNQELQYFHTAILSSLAFVICIVNDLNNYKLLRLLTNNHYVSVAWYSIYDVPTYTEIRVTMHLKNRSTS